MVDKKTKIAGVEPVAYTDDGDGLFTRDQVQELMIEFMHTIGVNDIDSRDFAYNMGMTDLAGQLELGAVDEFMNSEG